MSKKILYNIYWMKVVTVILGLVVLSFGMTLQKDESNHEREILNEHLVKRRIKGSSGATIL